MKNLQQKIIEAALILMATASAIQAVVLFINLQNG